MTAAAGTGSEELAQGVLEGRARAIGRAISEVERDSGTVPGTNPVQTQVRPENATLLKAASEGCTPHKLFYAATFDVTACLMRRNYAFAQNVVLHLVLQEAAAASEVADFMVSLFQFSDPGRGASPDATARQILDEGKPGHAGRDRSAQGYGNPSGTGAAGSRQHHQRDSG